MLAHMVIHVTLPAGFSCPGKTGAEQRRRPFHLTAFTLWFKAQQAVGVTHHGDRRQRHRRAGDHRLSRVPVSGQRIPAAIGIPSEL